MKTKPNKQDPEEMSSAEVIGCSVTAGVSSSNRTLSEAVTGRTDLTVHRRGNNSVRTERSGTG